MVFLVYKYKVSLYLIQKLNMKQEYSFTSIDQTFFARNLIAIITLIPLILAILVVLSKHLANVKRRKESDSHDQMSSWHVAHG